MQRKKNHLKWKSCLCFGLLQVKFSQAILICCTSSPMYKKCYVHSSVIHKGITRVFNIYIGIKIKCLFFFLIDTIIEFIKQFVAKKYHISAWASFHWHYLLTITVLTCSFGYNSLKYQWIIFKKLFTYSVGLAQFFTT